MGILVANKIEHQNSWFIQDKSFQDFQEQFNTFLLLLYICLFWLTQIQIKFFTYPIERVPNKSNCDPNNTGGEMKQRGI